MRTSIAGSFFKIKMEESAESKQSATTSDGKDKEETEELPSTTALKDAIDKTIAQTLLAISHKKSAFPSIYKSNKTRINELLKSTAESVYENTLEEVDLIFEDFAIHETLNQLDKTKKSFTLTGKKKWRPTGDVEKDLRAHLMEKKLEHGKELKEILKAEKKTTRQLEINNAKQIEQLSKLISKTKQFNDDFLSSSSNE